MAEFKNKTELKDVFNGLSSLFYTDKAVDLDGSNDAGLNEANIPAFDASTPYKVGDVVKSGSKYYECIKAGTATAVTQTSNFKEIASPLMIDWQYELPVTVDTLQISQDDPTINHYKVIGMQGDWTSSAEAGDFNLQFTVPTKAKEVIKLAFGEQAYKEITEATITGGESAGVWEGFAVTVQMQKVTGTIGILDETKKNLMLITNIALYAKPMYENASTEPFAIQFSGSIETSGDANFAWLKKKEA